MERRHINLWRRVATCGGKTKSCCLARDPWWQSGDLLPCTGITNGRFHTSKSSYFSVGMSTCSRRGKLKNAGATVHHDSLCWRRAAAHRGAAISRLIGHCNGIAICAATPTTTVGLGCGSGTTLVSCCSSCWQIAIAIAATAAVAAATARSRARGEKLQLHFISPSCQNGRLHNPNHPAAPRAGCWWRRILLCIAWHVGGDPAKRVECAQS